MSYKVRNWKPAFRAARAIYEMPPIVDGEPLPPHVNTEKSDTHTTNYFKSDIRNRVLMQAVAADLAGAVRARGERPSLILGHAPFTVILTAYLAEQLGADCAYAMRNDQGRYATWFDIREGEDVMVVADDVVTGRSTVETIEDAESRGAIVSGIVPCLANLSRRPDLVVPSGNRELIAAATFEPTTHRVRQDVCMLCELGSIALQPRRGDNWATLQGWMSAPPTA